MASGIVCDSSHIWHIQQQLVHDNRHLSNFRGSEWQRKKNKSANERKNNKGNSKKQCLSSHHIKSIKQTKDKQ
eukprot:4273316-Ditylum_brightwellii.AAC.1